MLHSLRTLALAGLLSAGCVPGNPSTGSTEAGGSENLINGRLDEEHRNVFLLEHVHGSGASEQIGHCTGTLIGTHTILTAAHCAVDGDEWTVFVDDSVAPFYLLAPPVSDPLWTHSLGDARHDFAVLLLDRDVTGIEPAQLLVDAPEHGETITLVGFGLTCGGVDNQKRYSGTNTISAIAPGVFFTQGTDRAGTAGARGDSGGPAFVARANQAFLSGVMALSDTCAAPAGQSGCLETRITRIDDRLDWIREQAEGNLYDGRGYDPTPLPTQP